MTLETQNLIEDIENNPRDYIGKIFNAKCKFRVYDGFHICQMLMKIKDIIGTIIQIEPIDKRTEDAQILRKFWFGSNMENDYS